MIFKRSLLPNANEQIAMQNKPTQANAVPMPEQRTVYPPPFAALVKERSKRKLGDYFGLTNFGVNLTELAPGAISALLHCHAKQDEFIYILEGRPTLVLGEQEYVLEPGDCMGLKAGAGIAHQLVNASSEKVVYIEIGDRTIGDEVEYPKDDLRAVQLPNGQWQMTHKNGEPY